MNLPQKAAQFRLQILETALLAGKGHVPPAFSCIDLLTALYCGGIINVRPEQPDWAKRDRFILSKGHASLALYVVLAEMGFFDSAELDGFDRGGSMLAGHPDREIPGVDGISGSLGHGLGVGAGLALGAKMRNQTWRTFVLLGDSECNEGSIWEAAMFAAHHKLNNLTAMVDRNRLGATNFTEETLKLEPFVDKWRAFGWRVHDIDGHDFDEIFDALNTKSEKPVVLIANTVKGKGVHFMENSIDWHHALPGGEQARAALDELRTAII